MEETKEETKDRVSVMNAKALAASMDALREDFVKMQAQIVGLGQGLSNANRLIQSQTQVIGEFIAKQNGTGPTTKEDGG